MSMMASSPRSPKIEEPLLSVFALLCLCLPAAAVQVGWTVGESLIIPYLLSLGASSTVANIAFLLNPVAGLFLQPMVGHASDNCQSALGRRRPFLLLFHFGSVTGLLSVVFAKPILDMLGVSSVSDSGSSSSSGASVAMIGLVMVGFSLADMSHDLLLMPARALLNDSLPDSQIDSGNSIFALVSMLGSIIGLGLVILPLDRIAPFRALESPIRATFVTAASLVLLSNLTTFIISRPIDKTLDELRADEAEEGTVHAEASLSLASLGRLYRILPRPLVVVWFSQFIFWLCVLPVNIWVSSYVGVELFGATSGDESGMEKGVRRGAVGLLIQSVIAFAASSLISRANASFGLTNVYHYSAMLYSLSVCALWLKPPYWAFCVIMAVTGIALPALYSSPFTLIEVHANDEDSESGSDDDSDCEGPVTDSNQSTKPSSPQSVPHFESNPDRGRPLEHVHLTVRDRHEDAPLLTADAFTMSFLDDWRGVLTGVFNLAMIAAQIVVGLTSGALIDYFDDISVVFILSGSLAFVIHLAILTFGLSKPSSQSPVEEEIMEEIAEEVEHERPRIAPLMVRAPTLPPVIDYGAMSSRAGRLRSNPFTQSRHVRHITTHRMIDAQPELKRSSSAPALVLLARPKRIHRGVPVFQDRRSAGGMTSDRQELERQRERTRLFAHIATPSMRRATTGAATSRHHDHERRLWFSGSDSHRAAVEEQERAAQQTFTFDAAPSADHHDIRPPVLMRANSATVLELEPSTARTSLVSTESSIAEESAGEVSDSD